MSRLTWYARRLRSMSPSEIAWRASRITAGAARSLGRHGEPKDTALVTAGRHTRGEPDWAALLAEFRAATGRPVLLDRARAARLADAHPDGAAALLAAADRALEHRFSYFGYPEQALGPVINWHTDPLTGTDWPAIPSARIDHRTSLADPKWIWELNRLQHLPWLAQAWLITGDDRYAQEALDQLDSWLAQNPPGIGIAWRGAFEAGIRAISVAVALGGLRDCPALTPDRYRRLVRMLAESARRCWQQRSRFSSANNHLVGELAGLATVALMFPELAHARVWEQRALRALSVEADLQILPDGAGAEQAVGYQVFTAELLLVVVTLLRLRGDEPPAALVQAVDRSATFLAALVGDDDPAPRYGDDDEGFAVRLDAAPLRTVRDHLTAVAAVTGNPAAARAGRAGLSAGWFAAGALAGSARAADDASTDGTLAGNASPGASPHAAAPPANRYAPDGGLVVLRSGGRRVTMDVGPLGYLSIAAHGHADALALTLSVAGRELVGDPGAGSYYGHPGWRVAHRGTRAHATVCVDDTDQSLIGGPFMWSEHATVTVRGVDLDRGVVDAEHDGYRRLAAPVRHRRWLLAPPHGEVVLVVDQLTGRGEHTARVSWPLHPALHAAPAPCGHLVSAGSAAALQLAYAATAQLTPFGLRGDPDTHLGWWSERLESREPSWLVGTLCEGCVPLVVATVLAPLDADTAGAPVSGLAVAQEGRTLRVTWRYHGEPRAAVIDTSRSAAVTLPDEHASR